LASETIVQFRTSLSRCHTTVICSKVWHLSVIWLRTCRSYDWRLMDRACCIWQSNDWSLSDFSCFEI